MAKPRALVLFSGGLDSILAAKTLAAQGVEVELVCFTSNFFNADNAIKSAGRIGLKLHILRLDVLLPIVKNPPSGYGKNLNPCIDCHALMIKTAWEKLGKDFDLIATGEVLGQRPFSQNRDALIRVKKLSGVDVLRPLSAKLLDETEAEKSGIINRNRLHEISGRGRYKQMELAERYGVNEHPSPAGGCLLTDPAFSERLLAMLNAWPGCSEDDIELLKLGRVYWLKSSDDSKVLIIVGRHQKDNEALEMSARSDDCLLELVDIVGPITLIRSKYKPLSGKDRQIEVDRSSGLRMSSLRMDEVKNDQEIFEIAAHLTAHHASKTEGKIAKVSLKILNN